VIAAVDIYAVIAARTPTERAAHHAQAVRDHEASAEATIAAAEFYGREAWMRYLRDRIEGHAVRAIVALLEALSS
jgi:hypothetical protein